MSEREDEDAIEMLQRQHREVETLFGQLDDAEGAEARRLFLEIADQLTIHATIEERHFYPAMREPKTHELIEQSLADHLTMKSILRSLLDMDLGDPSFDAQLEALKAEVFHHVEEEESKLFLKVPSVLNRDQLTQIAQAMRQTQEELERGEPRSQLEVEVEPPQPSA